MLIEVRTDASIDGDNQLSDQVKSAVSAALHRYGDRIRRIDVHLSDAAGNKTSHDNKRCSIEMRRDGCEPIVVATQESSMDQAIHGAVHKLKTAVDGAFGREAALVRLRDHH